MEYFDKVVKLADDTMKTLQFNKIPWMWGEALLLHAMGQLNEELNEDRYTDYIKNYCDYHIKKGYRIDQSDTLAPTLATYYLQKKFADKKYQEVTNRGLEYIRNSKKIIHNMPNHLGSSLEGRFYPKSIWVDSIMMYGVFTSLYAKEQNEKWLMDFALTQPKFFKKYLQDEDDKLFVHSYWVKSQKKYPNKLYWGRGNGWVIAGIAMLIGNFEEGPEKEMCKELMVEVSDALLKYQREDGYFESVLNYPNTTLKESSATALIASGWMRGVREGYLDVKYLEPAIKAFKAVVDDLDERDNLTIMRHISAPTIALHIAPRLGYKLQYTFQKSHSWSYGIAALIFAAIEYKKIIEKGGTIER